MERIEEGVRFPQKLRFAVILVVAVALIGCMGSPEQVKLSMPELSRIADGTYRGSTEIFPVLVQVEVAVASGRITSFAILKHRTGRGKAAEVLASQVVEKQTIEIDTVSGATYSSKAILKAGENALRSGLMQEGEETK